MARRGLVNSRAVGELGFRPAPSPANPTTWEISLIGSWCAARAKFDSGPAAWLGAEGRVSQQCGRNTGAYYKTRVLAKWAGPGLGLVNGTAVD